MAVSGLNALAGYNAITDKDPFATPEQRMGGPAHPYHAHVGEQGIPYSSESLLTPGAKPGPRGLENQLLSDEFWFLESAGDPYQDPRFDYNMPSLTRSHGSVRNISGPANVALSQAESINLQTKQMDNKSSNLNTDKALQRTTVGDVAQDNWLEIWNVTPGAEMYPPGPSRIAIASAGHGAKDRTSNPFAARNEYEFDSSHMHRRYAWSSIPGNYMWMTPQGRPLFKSIPGTAKPPIGAGSQFEGQDLGFAFSYDTGATLMDTPTEYVPPPSPNIAAVTSPAYGDPMGTDPIPLW